MTVGEEQASTNIEGTRAVVEFARRVGATLHHVSSIAVAGDHVGRFDETDFDLGQGFPSPYHRTKFEAERLVREASDLRWRVYRPAVVVGDSRTGEINKIDGPYYLFSALAALARLPHALPVLVPDLGSTNIVPVDYVADALVELLLAPGLDGRTFHLTNPTPQPLPEIYGALADAAGAPRLLATVPSGPLPALLTVDLPGRDAMFRRLGIPPVLRPPQPSRPCSGPPPPSVPSRRPGSARHSSASTRRCSGSTGVITSTPTAPVVATRTDRWWVVTS